MLFNSPVSSQKVNQLIDVLNLSPTDRVLDAGCGAGEMLIRMVEKNGAEGLGIDLSSDLIDAARKMAAQRVPNASLEFRVVDMKDAALVEGSFDLAVCMGSTHAFGSGDEAYPKALDELSRLVRPGGQLLIGEGYWKQPPAAEYVEFIGEPVGIYHDHETKISFAEERGFRPLYAAVSNDDEWDHFEWLHKLAIEREFDERPDDPALAGKLKRSREWRNAYLRWGRTTMGFGFYLFQNTAAVKLERRG